MCIVAAKDRLASASVVFFGHHGAVTHHAQQRDVSRQSLYRQAHSLLEDLEHPPHLQHIAHLQQQRDDLHTRLLHAQQQLRHAVLIDADKQAHFASVAQAEGVSLPLARRLLHILLHDRTPSVAQLGRWTKDTQRRASATLAVLDQFSNPKVHDAALDELFAARKPLLMAVELDSLAWVVGKLSPSRDGAAWAEQLRTLPALSFVSRDAGSGLSAGIKQINRERVQVAAVPGGTGRSAAPDAVPQPQPLDDQDDHFHLLREGARALRQSQNQVSRAMDKAEKADKKCVKVARQIHTTAGVAGAAARAWKRAEAAFQRFCAAEAAWTRLRQQALPLFVPSGELNSREKAEAVLAEVLPALDGAEWAKVRRLLRRPGYFTFLDRVAREVAALPVSAELVQAAVEVEGERRCPEVATGPSSRCGVYRALVVLATVTLGRAGEAGRQALTQVRGVLRRAWRASSAVEGLNSVMRMHQGRHRRLTQGLLDLKRLNWNCRPLRTGKRKGKTPYGLLGLKLPTTDWWQLLKIPPDQLRQQLSALQVAS